MIFDPATALRATLSLPLSASMIGMNAETTAALSFPRVSVSLHGSSDDALQSRVVNDGLAYGSAHSVNASDSVSVSPSIIRPARSAW